ncbi:hypothetical protein F2P44_17570 [Massilia sp. CCM 8695]|uniref:Uncharacterized protein n=1 Tax=Massilia frigida TaxID=2609281 RepID=A0ABX0N786_9BURK|nr:hypothetical protein [Massilia frigida]NHZ81069.1 hypothetical protein [Massilia frigida]
MLASLWMEGNIATLIHCGKWHRIDCPDRSPKQMASADLLAHYRRCETELDALKAAARPDFR